MSVTASFELDTPDGRIRGDAHLAGGASTGVVICHGFKGFARWAFFPHVARSIAGAGLNAIAFDFTGSGIGPDRESFTDFAAFESNTFSRELRDLAAVIADGRRRGWLSGRIGLFGHSRGGAIAILHTARHADVGALVTWSAFANVVRWSAADRRRWRERGFTEIVNARTGQVLRLGLAVLEEAEREGDTRLNILLAAGAVRAPWLIVHGSRDETVDVGDAERLGRAASSGVARVELIENAGHAYEVRHPLGEPSPALDRATELTVSHFREWLAPAGSPATSRSG